jgi:hypothetical protein
VNHEARQAELEYNSDAIKAAANHKAKRDELAGDLAEARARADAKVAE